MVKLNNLNRKSQSQNDFHKLQVLRLHPLKQQVILTWQAISRISTYVFSSFSRALSVPVFALSMVKYEKHVKLESAV